jgi:hypothetical protein
MPLAGYFRNVGAALFALLLIADFYLPAPPVAQKAAAHPPVIRIHADRKAAEPVIFDTAQVAIAAAAPAPWDSNPPAPPVHAIPANHVDVSGVRDAFAWDSRREASVEKKRQPVRRYAARDTRRLAQPHIVLAARQPQFGWFGFRPW